MVILVCLFSFLCCFECFFPHMSLYFMFVFLYFPALISFTCTPVCSRSKVGHISAARVECSTLFLALCPFEMLLDHCFFISLDRFSLDFFGLFFSFLWIESFFVLQPALALNSSGALRCPVTGFASHLLPRSISLFCTFDFCENKSLGSISRAVNIHIWPLFSLLLALQRVQSMAVDTSCRIDQS